MLEINDLLKKNHLRTNYYKKMGKSVLIDTNKGKLVVKEKVKNNIYEYLNSRSFNYYPNIVSDDSKYEIMEYIDNIDMPSEQKMLDMIKLISLLHNKTTYYKEVLADDYKKIYEDINNNIEYLFSYYSDLITVVESHVYMSPSEYILARGITKIFNSLSYSKREIDNWYQIVKEQKKQRYVVLHNNLELDHFIKNNNSYLISWEKAKIDIPIFDLYKLYKKNFLDYDFESLIKEYENNYPLLKEEKILLFILISLPDKIQFDDSEYNMCIKIGKVLDSLYKADELISPYYSENTEPDKYDN